MKNKDLKKRIIEISYKHKLSHLGSCLTAVDIIKDIYDIKKPDEKFVLSAGHAGLALYVVIESKGGRNAEDIFNHHGVHPDACKLCGIDCSSGSLGQGLPIAVGMALSDRSRSVYCLISDGECAEGSIWEALRIIVEQKIFNLKIYLNMNGWGAYKEINNGWLSAGLNQINIGHTWGKAERLINFRYTDSDDFPFLKGQTAHYHVMSEDDYKVAMEVVK